VAKGSLFAHGCRAEESRAVTEDMKTRAHNEVFNQKGTRGLGLCLHMLSADAFLLVVLILPVNQRSGDLRRRTKSLRALANV
jgi:hypothetical protein